MATDRLLDDDELREALEGLPQWSMRDGGLHRELTFTDFNEAFGFMVRLALVAERMNHHPDWSNSWNKVVIDIISHAAGGLTARCVELAQAAEALASPHPASK